MSDVIQLQKHQPPTYLRWEHGAAWGRTGTTWFEWDTEDMPTTKPAGYVSRFEVPTAINMPAHREVGIALCNRIAAAIPKLSASQAIYLARHARRFDPESQEISSSLVRTGWRYGVVYQMEKEMRKFARTSKAATS